MSTTSSTLTSGGTLAGTGYIATTDAVNTTYEEFGCNVNVRTALLLDISIPNGTNIGIQWTSGTAGTGYGNNPLYITFLAKVPISGWSSNVQMSNDTLTQVVATEVTTAASLSATSGSALVFTTVTADSTGSYNASNGQYTCPVSGVYDVSVSGMLTTSTAINFSVYKNASAYRKIAGIGTTGAVVGSGFISLPCNAGDVLTIVPDATTTLLYTAGSNQPTATFSRKSGPSVVANTESVNGLYTDTAGGSIGTSPATYTFATKTRDTHNAYSSGTLTIPVSGMYTFTATMTTANFTLTTGQTFQVFIYRNGTQIAVGQVVGNGGSNFYNATASISYPCSAGDTITVRPASSAATNAYTTAGNNNFSWARVGN